MRDCGKMTAEQMAAELQAIDWKALLEKLPQAFQIFLQLLDLFKDQKPVMRAQAPCPEVLACLEEQGKDLMKALAHNCHLKNACAG